MYKIRKNDLVLVRAGKDKGKSGIVTRVFLGANRKPERVLVEGVNFVHHYVKRSRDSDGGIVRREAPIHISNVSIMNPVTNQADKVGFKILDSKKRRYFKSNGEIIDTAS